MAQWVTVPTAQAHQPEFSPWTPHKGGQRQLTLQSCHLTFAPHTSLLITTTTKTTISIIKFKSLIMSESSLRRFLKMYI